MKNGVCSTKLDHVFALNFEVGSIVSCTSAHKFIKQGGHSVIETRARFPNLSIPASSTEDTNPDRPIYIDYEKTTPCQIEALHREVSEILSSTQLTYFSLLRYQILLCLGNNAKRNRI